MKTRDQIEQYLEYFDGEQRVLLDAFYEFITEDQKNCEHKTAVDGYAWCFEGSQTDKCIYKLSFCPDCGKDLR